MIRAAGCVALALAALGSTVRPAPAATIVWPGSADVEGRALASVPDPDRPDAIALLVGRFGVAATGPWLRTLLASGPTATRLYVARLLVRSGDLAARAVVLGWLTSPHALPNERALAVDALSWSIDQPGGEELRATFEQAARDRDTLTRTEALDALARLDAAAPPGISPDISPDISPSLPVYLGALDDADREVRLRAVHLVTRAAETHDAAALRVAPMLLERLDDSDRQVRVAALEALGRLRDPRTVTALVRLAAGDPPDLQVVAIDALGWPGNDAAVATLADLLRRWSANEAGRHAARALGTVATPEAVRVLIDALRVPPVPDEVERALAAAGPAAIEPLAGLAAGLNVAAAARAVALLGRTGDARAVAPLARAGRQHGGNGPLALAAVEALDRLGRGDATTPILAEAAEAPEPEIRRAALAGLAAAADPRAVAVLERGLADADPTVRAAAVDLVARLPATSTAVLGAGGMERAVDRVADALADPVADVRRAAARALATFGGRPGLLVRALTSLSRSAALPRDPEERGALGDALAALASEGDAGRLDAAFVAAPDALVLGDALATAHARAPIGDRRIVGGLLDALDRDAVTAAAAADALGFAQLSSGDAGRLARAAAGAEPAVRARLCPAVAALPEGAAWLTAWMAPDQPVEVRAAAAWAARQLPEADEALRGQATGDGPVAANARAALAARAAGTGEGPTLVRLVDTAGVPLAGRWVRIGRPDLWVSARSDGRGRIRIEGLPGEARMLGP